MARTITLLQPDSKAASTAYIVALEGAIKVSGKPEGEKEVEVRLNQLLQSKIEQTQLQALWHAFKENNHQEGLDLVAAEGKRRFPADSTFAEIRPSVGLRSAGINHRTDQSPQVQGSPGKSFAMASPPRFDSR